MGITKKPTFTREKYAGSDPAAARKSEREIYLPELQSTRTVPVFDGHRMRFGFRIGGPAIIEQVNTTLFLSSAFDCVTDPYGSFSVYAKGREDLIEKILASDTTAEREGTY